MKRFDEYLSMAELIHKHHVGELTPRERQQLEQWIERNTALYERVIADKTIANRILLMDALKNERPAKRRKIFIRVARVAAVLLPVAVALFLLLGRDASEPAVAVDDSAFVHSNRASLVLENGEIVDLSDKRQVIGKDSVALIEDARITYRRDEQAEARINTLIIPRKASYTVHLADGTTVHVNAESKLSYKTNFTGETREVYLEGEAYFIVARDEKPFVVKTNLGQVKVYGTEFNLRQYGDENMIQATLVSGSVGYSNDLVKEVILKPRQQLSYTPGEPAAEIKEVDTEIYTAWKDNVLYFVEQPLFEIMRNLSRRYDITFSFEDESLKQRKMSGRLGQSGGFDSFVKIFSAYDDINLRVDGNHVTISK
jgi:ferric-dicitrate binding protein FerR (iron transport regulator)